jgi:hypothetical protein
MDERKYAEVMRKARWHVGKGRELAEQKHNEWLANRDPAADDLNHWRSTMPKPEPSPSKIEPDNKENIMDEKNQAAWDHFVRAHIKIALAEDWKSTKKVLDGLCAGMGAEVGQLVRRLNKRIDELEEQLGQLRADLEIQKAVAKREVLDLPNFRGKQNVA